MPRDFLVTWFLPLLLECCAEIILKFFSFLCLLSPYLERLCAQSVVRVKIILAKLSHIIGGRGPQHLQSPYPIMAPAETKRNLYLKHYFAMLSELGFMNRTS